MKTKEMNQMKSHVQSMPETEWDQLDFIILQVKKATAKRLQLINSDAPFNEIFAVSAEIGRLTMQCAFRCKVVYDTAALTTVNDYLNVIRDIVTDDKEHQILNIGAFVGEVLIRKYRGEWYSTKHGFGKNETTLSGVVFRTGIATNPFLRVERQFDQGQVWNILDYHRGINQLISTGELEDDDIVDYDEVYYKTI